ncbi:MAG: hypothetical protein HYZ33_03805 [Ignavibacteriales bacterium]|nr:hypothetical protein [Ignavibacteriales bacterium]
MKLLIALLFTCSSFFQSSTDLSGKFTKKDSFEKKMKFSASEHRTLEVDLVSGSITVTGTDDETISITANRSIKAKTKESLGDAEKNSSLEIEETNGTLTLYHEVPYRDEDGAEDRTWFRYGYNVRYDVEIKLPRHVKLDLKTIERGKILVENIVGDFHIKHVNGDIAIENISGSGSVSTINGDISVAFRENPKEDCSFKTINGDITTRFQDHLSADCSLNTIDGELLTEFDVQQPSKRSNDYEPKLKRVGSKRVYKSGDATQIRIGDGGPKFSYSTINGDISLLKQ